MMRTRKVRSAALLAVVALAGAGCSDTPTPTAPAATRGATALSVTAARPRPRVPYIADLQLSSIYVDLSGTPTPFTVTVTNPSQKDFSGIYLKGELQSRNNQPPTSAPNFIAYCPLPNGIVPSGDCTMSDGITAGANLAPGPGVFTLRVVQQQADGTVKVLDSKSVDVELRQYI